MFTRLTAGGRGRYLIGLGLLVLAIVGIALALAFTGSDSKKKAATTTSDAATTAGLDANDWRVEVYSINNCTVSRVCSYFGHVGTADALPGETISVYQHNRKVATATTNRNGYAVIKLPNGASTVWFSHQPYEGQNWATRTFPVTAPVSHLPGSKYDFIFHTSSR
jgi:hypothetical protein